MTQVIQRSFPRIYFQAPIQYGVANGVESADYHQSKTLNYSAGGFCYETGQQLMPEEEVCIIMSNYSPGRNGPEGYRSYLTRIRWVHPVSKKSVERFVAGARIIARSHEVLDAISEAQRHNCDLCGALVSVCLMQCTDENAQLCEQCHKHFEALPQGKIRRCLERFMTGNVV